VKHLAEFTEVVTEAVAWRGPHRIAAYAQDTAKAFHQFYKQCRVLGERPDVERSRLALCRATARDGHRPRPRRSAPDAM
jgi:arginyl-tRNA synthetase